MTTNAHPFSALPERLRLIHPTGDSETVGDFATALIFVDQVIYEIRDHIEHEAPKEVQS